MELLLYEGMVMFLLHVGWTCTVVIPYLSAKLPVAFTVSFHAIYDLHCFSFVPIYIYMCADGKL